MSLIRQQTECITSTVNSSDSILTTGATFTGTAELNSFTDVMVTIETDQDGTLYIEFSPDGTNWDSSLSFNYITTRIHPPHIVVKANRYVRVRFENTSTSDQTYLRLNTYYGQFNKLTTRTDSVLPESFDAIPTRPSDYNTEVAEGRREGASLWNKFGYNDDIDVGTEVVASWGGTFTPLTTAGTLLIASSSVNDTNGGTGCNSIVIYGIDSNREEQIEVVTMNGTTTVNTVSTWLGINRVAMFLCGSGQINAGDIAILSSVGGATMAVMPSGGGVTQQCIFYVPANNTFIMEWLMINVLNQGKNAELNIKVWVYSAVSNGKQEVFRVNIDTAVTNEPIEINPNLPFPVSEKTVVWIECTSDKANVIVNARFSGILDRIN